VKSLASKGPHAIKIVTLARRPEDNLRVLELIAFARESFDTRAVAFCMGPLGKWSRAVSLLLGSPWTYVQLPGQGAAAPGQYSAKEMRALLIALEASSLP
jgi:3-dehydroquinate dehydratase type I